MKAGKGFTLFISNEDNYKITRRFKCIDDGITETVKHERKKQEGEFLPALLAPLATSIVQPVTYSVVKGIRERGVSRAGRGYMNKTFLVLLHPLTNIERDH